MANIIDGRKIADGIINELKEEVSELRARGIIPGLAVIVAGDNPASKLYVKRKREMAAHVGINSFVHEYDAHVTQDELQHKLNQLNHDPKTHAILVQLPLPPYIDAIQVINTIDPSKDVDGFTIQNVGRLNTGQPGLFPCTPLGCMHLIKSVEPDLRGLRTAILGKSNIVGRPMLSMLLNSECTVTLINRHTPNPEKIAREHDILVSATGQPGLITSSWVNSNMIVIDVGITRDSSGIVGDVDFDSVKDKVRAITPVPGGVGPMTIAYLLKNTLQATRLQNRLHTLPR
jgi:methylenetetrahydrofolate dehydrogenase (NADP+)/methenyltetrahydrofolate cyclohydrolase